MSSGPSSTCTGRSAAEELTAKAISPEASDSGYGSTASTTDGSTTDHSLDFADGFAVPQPSFFERSVTRLRVFDREIPKSTQDRFHDLYELFERSLCDHLTKAKINPYPISLKLKCLGESEATAKPWIVVLCDKTATKQVRRFFNKQHIKAAYQPSNPDSSLPSFEICYYNRPPRSMAGAEIYGDYDERSTMCGRIIKVGEAHQSRFATLGGVIRVIKPSGVVMLYGMTAGHILAQQPRGQYGFEQVDVQNEGDEEDEGYDSCEEEYELDDTFEGDGEAQKLATTGNMTRTFSQSTQLGHLWPEIGSVFAASNEGTITGQDHDWALIEFVRVADYLPNLLVSFSPEEKTAKHRPLMENGKSTEDGSSRKVFLLSGTGGVQSGTLSTSLSFLMMGPAKAFAKTYTLVLPHRSMLNSGDCGSWVVDESTCEVYGHVVASDAMGDIYVVPLNATLRDMENKLGAAVSLPTEADIHKWLAQQTKAVAEQITVPAGNKKKRVAFNDSKMDQVEFPKDLQKLTGHSSSLASIPLPPRSIKSSTPIADYTIASAGPRIVVHRSESLERSWRPAVQGSHGPRGSNSSEYSSSHESLVLDDLAIGDPSDSVDIPRSIQCFFFITFDGAKASAAASSLAIDYTESNSYQSVEKAAQDIAQDHVRASSTGILVPRQFNFKYGNCTVIGDHVEKIGLPLTTREDWESVCTILVNYWRSDPLRTLHVDIYRDYFSYRSRAANEVSLAATKGREMHNLIKYPLGNEPYIPRTALMRLNSLQNIREIIFQDDRLDMEPEEREHLIETVQSSAPCLLALCVYAGLKMECLNLFLQRGFSDAALPTQIKDCCHDKCAPSFSTLLRMRGGFMPARFDKIGEHQDFHHTVVIPIHFVPVEEDQDEIMRAGRRRDLEEGRGSTTSVTDDAKQSACCGFGAYSNVYRVKIDPDHHRLSKDKNVDFALKEFRDRPNRGHHDFQRELKILDELRKYRPRHIVTHLATWTHQGKYYMLFPYAQCNLRQYMKWVQFGSPTKERIIWLIRQFRGLAEALKGIHDLSIAGLLQSTQDLITRPVRERRAGHHHDLKPENILFYGATGDFEISDFGSGKVHTYRSGSHNTPLPHGTLTYEPPEAAVPGGTSRPYDTWSLGCVFLELLIWAVLGFPVVEEFRKKRLDRRYPGSLTVIQVDDAFWQTLPNGDVTLCKAVQDCTKALREAILQQRNQPFKEILDLVIKMLDTVKETRIPALDLYDTLDKIYIQQKIDLENVGDSSLFDNNHSQEWSEAEGIEGSFGSTEKLPECAKTNKTLEMVQGSPSSRQQTPKALGAPRHPQSPVERSFIPDSIAYNLRFFFAFKCPGSNREEEEMSVRLHRPESYKEIEKVADKRAQILSADSIGPRELKFFYGNCTIVSDNGTKFRLPLQSPEDWAKVNNHIVGYWNSHTHERLRLCISRHYCCGRPPQSPRAWRGTPTASSSARAWQSVLTMIERLG